MRIKGKFSVLSAGIVMGALLLTGCSSSDGKKSAGESEKSPLQKRLAFLDSGDFDEAKYSEQQKQVEAAVAQCMKEEGFEYTPVDYDSGSITFISNSDYEDTQTSAYAKKYGYGIFSYPEEETLVEDAPEEEFVDPNQDYVSSLSENEQEDFYNTLYGPSPSENLSDEEMDAWYSDPANQGCYGTAQNNAYETENSFYDIPEVQDFFDIYSDFFTTVEEENTKIIELNDAWSQCITEKGYNFSSPDEAMESVYEINESFYTQAINEDGSIEPNAQEYKEPDPEVLEEAKENEIALATADYECQEKLDYLKKKTTLQWEIEEQFIKENESLIQEIEKIHKETAK